MTQPSIEGPKYGQPVMPYGSDGTNWIAVLIDALGHLQVDVVSAVLGSGGATEATLLLIKGYVDALETLLAGGLPAALDSGALKIKEQSPLTGFATATNQTTMITALQLIDDLRAALGSVNTDDLQVDVKTSALPTNAATETTLALIKGYVDNLETLLAGGLPAALDTLALKVKEQSPLTGFATSANQTTMITALQLIDDLRAALGSVNTDDLQVDVKTYPGSNALGNFPFGYYDVYSELEYNTALAAGTNSLTASTVPAGEVWVITAANIVYVGTTPFYTQISAFVNGIGIFLVRKLSPANYEAVGWQGFLVLKAGDNIVFTVSQATLNDDLFGYVCGYKMKVA